MFVSIEPVTKKGHVVTCICDHRAYVEKHGALLRDIFVSIEPVTKKTPLCYRNLGVYRACKQNAPLCDAHLRVRRAC